MEANRRPRAYYAAGLFNQAERAFNLEAKAVLDELGYDTWFPQEDAGFIEDYMDQGMSQAEARHFIFEQNLRSVDEADVLIFLLDGRVPDEGACIEAGIAFGRNKRCIGLKTDFRTVEPGGNNLMIDGVVDYRIAADLHELRELLAEERTVIDLRGSEITVDLRQVENPYVVVSGPLGVGKTALVDLMGRVGDWTVLPEPINENPYLSDVYSNLSDLAFRMLSFYFGQRALHHQSAKGMTGPIVQERSICEDGEVFMRAYRDLDAYDDNDLATLNSIYQALLEGTPVPDLVVNLAAPFDVTVARIKERDRDGESEMNLPFLRAVYDRYEQWALTQSRSPLVTIDTSELDYVNRPEDAAEVVRRIDAALTESAVTV